MALFEYNLLLEIQKLIGNKFFDNFFSSFTTFGNHGLIWILLILVLLINRSTRKLGILAACALILEFGLNDYVLKPLIARPRPFMTFEIYPIIERPTGFSFPSGHSASALAVATMVMLGKHPARHLVMISALLMAFSRMYLMVHYPSDVLAGILVGILCAWIVYATARRFDFDPTVTLDEPKA